MISFLKSLKAKIILSIICVLVAFGMGVVVVIFFTVQNSILENKTKDFRITLIEQAHQVEQSFFFSQLLAKTIASQADIIAYFQNPSRSPQEPHILEHLKLYNVGGIYSALYLIEPSGTTLISTDERFVGQNYGFRDYVSGAIKGEPVIDMAIGVTSREPGYYFSYPIRSSDQKILGVAVVKQKPDSIHQILKAFQSRSSAHAMFTDSFGVIIYSDNAERIYKSLGRLDEKELEIIKNKKRFENIVIEPLFYDAAKKELQTFTETRVREFIDPTNRTDELLGVEKVGETPFFIVSELDISNIKGIARKTTLFFLLTEFMGTVLVIIIIFLLLHFFLKPLDKLVAFTKEIGKGFFDKTLTVKTKGELGDLAGALNAMNAQLRLLNDTSKREKNVLNAILESIGDCLIVADRNGAVLLLNSNAAQLLGWQIDQMLNKSLFDSLPIKNASGRILPKTECPFFIAQHSKKSFLSTEYIFVRKDGTEFPAAITVSPIFLEGNVIGTVGIFRDFSAEKAIDRSKNEFIAVASHQLRTPLSNINWHLEALREEKNGKFNKKQKKYFDELYRNSERMSALVNALLNVSRIETGTLTITYEKIDLKKVLANLIEEQKQLVASKRLVVKKRCEKNLPLISSDLKLLTMILQNLLSNAASYTPPGGKIKLVASKKNNAVLIQISDTGYGIPEDAKQKIYEKFFRAENVKKKVPDGTGLGLYIAKSLANKLNCKIWFESQENKGTTFFLEIPLNT